MTDTELLTSAIDALIDGQCPFLRTEVLHDELHVDITDPECYLRSAWRAKFADDFAHRESECRAACAECIREGLEERVLAGREAS